MSFTSDLWAACKTNRYRWSRGIGGGVLSLSYTIGLMDCLASAELPVVCWCWTEPRGLVVACLNENCDSFISIFWSCTLFSMHLIIVPAGRFCVLFILHTLLTGITAAENSCLLRSPSRAPGRLWLTGLPGRGNDMTHIVDTNQKWWAVKICDWSTLNAEQVLAGMHGQAGRVTRWCECCDITAKTQKK